MSANSLDPTTYTDVAGNTVFNAVLDATKLLAWRQNVKDVVNQHASEINNATDSTEVFASPFTTGNAATSTTVLISASQYLLTTRSASGANSATSGMYLITRQGTSSIISAIITDVALTITVNASFNVVATNSSGAAREIECHLRIL